MKVFLVVAASIAFLTGTILLIAPKTLIRAGEVFNKVVGIVDMPILNRRWFWGTLFFLAGAYLFYVSIT